MSIENIQKIIENYILSVREKPFVKSAQNRFDKFKKFISNWFIKTGNSLEANQKQRVLKAMLVMLIQEGTLTLPVGDGYPTLKDENGNITFLPKESKEEILAIIGSEDNVLKWLAEDWQAVLDNIVTPQTRHGLFRYGAGGVTAVSDPWKNFKVIYSFKDGSKEYVFLKDNKGSVCIVDKEKYEADRFLAKNDPYEITSGFQEGFLWTQIGAFLNPPAVLEFMTNPVKAIIEIKNEIAKAKALDDKPALAKIYGSLICMILLAGHSGVGFLSKSPKAMAFVDNAVYKINTSFSELLKKAGRIKDDAIIKAGESVTGDLEGLLRVLRDPRLLAQSAEAVTPEGLGIRVPLSEIQRRPILKMEGALSPEYQARVDEILSIIQEADETGVRIGGFKARISSHFESFIEAVKKGKVEQSFLESLLTQLRQVKTRPNEVASIVAKHSINWSSRKLKALNGGGDVKHTISPLEDAAAFLGRDEQQVLKEVKLDENPRLLTICENLFEELLGKRVKPDQAANVFLKSDSFKVSSEIIRQILRSDHKTKTDFAMQILKKIAEKDIAIASKIAEAWQDLTILEILLKDENLKIKIFENCSKERVELWKENMEYL